MPFRFLEHTADIQVECRARTFDGLLETAANALYAIAFKDLRPLADIEHAVEISGAGREETLVCWLQELVFLMDAERFVATEFLFGRVNDRGVQARLRGYTYDPGERAEEVKGATHHELEVRETGEGLVARVIFDL